VGPATIKITRQQRAKQRKTKQASKQRQLATGNGADNIIGAQTVVHGVTYALREISLEKVVCIYAQQMITLLKSC
jgi:hypothetical protein